MSEVFFKSISSGSRGNCAVLWDSSDLIIIDFGISYRRFRNATDSFLPEGLNTSAFVSHEHSDHSSGLKTLKSKHEVDVYTRKLTGERIGIDFYPMERETIIGNFTITPVEVPHDAADPVVYVIRNGEAKICVVSDLGFAPAGLVAAIEGSDILAVEANHDVSMLKEGPYDPWLKKRILGDRGHLSNEQSADLISSTVGPESRIVLLHLSEKNNTPDLALNHVTSSLANREIHYSSIECATQDQGSSLYRI